MRHVIAVFAFSLAQATWAAPSAPNLRIDVPQDQGPQRVEQTVREFAVAAETGWHTHPGIEMVHVLSGTSELILPDGTRHRIGAGESFVIPSRVPHNAVNVGTGPLRLLVTFVIDRDAPLRAPAPDPRAHP